MNKRIILVGGFLGAGKTSLLFETANKLTKEGKRVGLITNDQAAELVDTTFLEYTKEAIVEVSGSCFCCNYQGFIDAVSYLSEEKQVDIIIAEPVGSCTDLSATILQPLKEQFKNQFVIAPLSVLIDPLKLADLLAGGVAGLHVSAAYIVRKQLEEADIIVINKTDLLSPAELELLKKRTAEEWPTTTVCTMSVKNDEGLEEWLNEVITRSDAGTKLAEVDYDIYAEGEAVLGWLNATIELQGEALDGDIFAKNYLEVLGEQFDSMNSAVGHVKLLLADDDSYLIGNLTGKKDSLQLRGSVGSGKNFKLTLNARVEMSPAELEQIVREKLAAVCGNEISSKIVALKCLSPGRPNPTHRYGYIVQKNLA